MVKQSQTPSMSAPGARLRRLSRLVNDLVNFKYQKTRGTFTEQSPFIQKIEIYCPILDKDPWLSLQ